MSDAPAADPIVVEPTDTGVIARLNLKLLDDKSLKRMDEMIDKAACGRPGVTNIVLDMSRVQIVPSLGLGALVQLMKKYKERRQHVKLAAVQPQVRTAMAITRLDRVLDLHDTVESAGR
jgi:anti-anti-sigma factor